MAKPQTRSRAPLGGHAPMLGEALPESSRQAPVLNLEESPPFTWVFDPFKLDVYETTTGPKVLPVPIPVSHAGGINRAAPLGFDAGRSLEVPQGDPAQALSYHRSLGRVVVPHTFECVAYVRVEGERERQRIERPGYVVRHKVRNGLYAHMSLWQRPYLVGHRVSFEVDTRGRYETLELMRDQLLGDLDYNALKSRREFLITMMRLAKAQTKGNGPQNAARLHRKLKAFEAYGFAPVSELGVELLTTTDEGAAGASE